MYKCVINAFKLTKYKYCFFRKDRLIALDMRGILMSLTEPVCFKTRVQSKNRLQIPELIRLRLKLETDQFLKVYVNILGVWGTPQTFLARITKDKRISIPKLNLALLQDRKLNFTGYVADVTLEPF